MEKTTTQFIFINFCAKLFFVQNQLVKKKTPAQSSIRQGVKLIMKNNFNYLCFNNHANFGEI